MTCTAGAFGSGGFGSLTFGSGAALALADAEQRSLNEVLVTFTVPPLAFDPANVADALFPDNWTIEAIDPPTAQVRFAQNVLEVSELQVLVQLDGPLDAPALYRIIANSRLQDADGQPISLCTDLDFQTFALERQPTLTQREVGRFDLANPQLPGDGGPPLGTYQINEKGDIALESGRQYLRKRILRRAMTALGEFFHLTDYGFAEPLKGNITPQLLLRLQARAQTQLAREPDVVSVQVSVQQLGSNPNIVVLTFVVQDVSGDTDEFSVSTRPDEVGF